MAGNSDKSANHKTLVDNDVIKNDANLSAVEDHVISELTPDEVQTLVVIRRKLDEAAASRATASTESFAPSSNIIV